MISRRKLLSLLLFSIGGGLLFPQKGAIGASFPQFFLAQLKYRGGDWDPNPQFVETIIEELELRTSIDGEKGRRVIQLRDPGLFSLPFLYMGGKYEFEPFTPEERELLRRYLALGGFLLAEDTLGSKGFGFDRAFRREIKSIFPHGELRKLSPDHAVYRSFYLIDQIVGRQRVNPFLEGITLDNWTPVVYSQNDLTGAWARDSSGQWLHECLPGGERQRSSTLKLGINIIVYSLTGDYKKDVIHHPFIRKRLNL